MAGSKCCINLIYACDKKDSKIFVQKNSSMKKTIPYCFLVFLVASSCNNVRQPKGNDNQVKTIVKDTSVFRGYAQVNGIKMYYEIHGQGQPIVLIHGGGSTIETTFGRVIPIMAQH